MKVLCILYDDPKGGMPKSYPLGQLPKIEKYPDGSTGKKIIHNTCGFNNDKY